MVRRGVSLIEAARRLHMSQSHLFMALQKGEIPTFRKDGRTVVSQGALREYQSRKRLSATYRS
ncbi:MAG: DNA-binding protein [Fischerella sp.]|nr:DNA-binding protein [Fischerella sp.]